jgi:hypothetical protein
MSESSDLGISSAVGRAAYSIIYGIFCFAMLFLFPLERSAITNLEITFNLSTRLALVRHLTKMRGAMASRHVLLYCIAYIFHGMISPALL